MAKVLLADDDEEYRRAFSRGMDALGHEVATVASGDEVMSAISEDAPDIIFLDVLMPGGGAISRVHEVRRQIADVPIVIITGNAAIFTSPIVTEGMRGANARVSKSTSLVELQAMIEDLTRG